MTNAVAKQRQKTLQRVRAANDCFRRSLVGGAVCISIGATALAGRDLERLFIRITTVVDFEFHGDPYGEHDFGIVEFNNTQIFWKIDSAERARGGFADREPRVPLRVLTIMLADEF